MKIGFIGLGRMGGNAVLNLLDNGQKVVIYNRHKDKIRAIVRKGAIGAYSLEELVKKLPKPRTVVMMITAGRPVDDVLSQLLPLLSKKDTIVEAGNSWYGDSVRRHKLCKRKGIDFLDMGTSGGLMGARHGASLMIGGDRAVFRRHEALFRSLATKGGYAYFGPAGSGHFVKMVHNGIEYAIEEAFGEGFELLDRSGYRYNYADVCRVWNHGSIVRSFLCEMAWQAFRKDAKLRGFTGKIGGGETGRWTLKAARRKGVEVETIRHAVAKRKQSLKKQSLATKVVSAMRYEFGGHEEAK